MTLASPILLASPIRPVLSPAQRLLLAAEWALAVMNGCCGATVHSALTSRRAHQWQCGARSGRPHGSFARPEACHGRPRVAADRNGQWCHSAESALPHGPDGWAAATVGGARRELTTRQVDSVSSLPAASKHELQTAYCSSNSPDATATPFQTNCIR
jgi:hypothetical protein